MTENRDMNSGDKSDKSPVWDEHAGPKQGFDIEESRGHISLLPDKRLRAQTVSRVSSDPQAGPNKISHKKQTQTMLDRAKRWGYVTREPIEITVSGADQDAAHLQKLDRLVEAKLIDVIMFYSVDRAFRDLMLGMKCLERWSAAGILIYVGDKRVDVCTADGRLDAETALANAEHRRGKLIEAANEKHRYAREEGRWYGPVPLGYDGVEIK